MDRQTLSQLWAPMIRMRSTNTNACSRPTISISRSDPRSKRSTTADTWSLRTGQPRNPTESCLRTPTGSTTLRKTTTRGSQPSACSHRNATLPANRSSRHPTSHQSTIPNSHGRAPIPRNSRPIRVHSKTNQSNSHRTSRPRSRHNPSPNSHRTEATQLRIHRHPRLRSRSRPVARSRQTKTNHSQPAVSPGKPSRNRAKPNPIAPTSRRTASWRPTTSRRPSRRPPRSPTKT